MERQRTALRRLGDLSREGLPFDPDRLYASQTSGWFGQIIQRSDDAGKTWHQPGTPPGEPAKTGKEPLLVIGAIAGG